MNALRTVFGKIFGREEALAPTLPRAAKEPTPAAARRRALMKEVHRRALADLEGTTVRIPRLPRDASDNSQGNGYHTRQAVDRRPPAARYGRKEAA